MVRRTHEVVAAAARSSAVSPFLTFTHLCSSPATMRVVMAAADTIMRRRCRNNCACQRGTAPRGAPRSPAIVGRNVDEWRAVSRGSTPVVRCAVMDTRWCRRTRNSRLKPNSITLA